MMTSMVRSAVLTRWRSSSPSISGILMSMITTSGRNHSSASSADRTIEVIMITAYASLETVKHALTNGAFEYLIKPFARQDLEAVVRRALLRRHAELGARGEVVRLVEEMRQLSAKTRELEEAARREAVEQSLRVT